MHHRRILLFLACTVVTVLRPVCGSELVSSAPLNESVLLLHFDDGYVRHHKRGEPRTQESTFVQPLNLERASNPGSYRLHSASDSNYFAGVSPTRIGRKSKGTDFGWFMEKWENGRAINTRPDHAKEHWVYLFLPERLRHGHEYTLRLDGIATNRQAVSFKFNEHRCRSEAIHVNLVGYTPAAPRKAGYLFHWMGDAGSMDIMRFLGREFWLAQAESSEVVYRGKVAFRFASTNAETGHVQDSLPYGNFLNADVAECDFSEFRTPGRYVLVIEGVGCSFPFRLDADIFREPFRVVARGLYHNRSGIELKTPFTEFARPAPHHPALTPGFQGKLLYTSIPFSEWGSEGGDAKKLMAGVKGGLDSWGWYQDAGDWDSYESHLRVPAELLTVFEMVPRNFRDSELNLPESGNGIPDILDEAAWLPRFCHRLRQELLKKKYGTGGVGLRVAGDAFGDDEKKLPDGRKVGQGSWEDVNRTWVVSGEDSQSSFHYAGVAAHLAFCLQLAGCKDPQGVDWATEAGQSYAWAESRSSGEQSSGLRARRAYAAAALFRLTGEPRYERQYQADVSRLKPGESVWDAWRFGLNLCALGGGRGKFSEANQERAREIILKTADHMVDTANRRALRWGGNWYMPMVIGQQTTPWVLELAVAHTFTKAGDPDRAARYLSVLYSTCNYFLGCNALNQTWVTGLGPRSPLHPFHMDAWYNGKDHMHAGIIPYGPVRRERDYGNGPWDTAWAYKTVYPDIKEWPGNESYFENRCCPGSNEFTIHQNTGPAAAIFGFLCSSTN